MPTSMTTGPTTMGGKQLFDFFYADGFYYDGQNYVNKTCADKSYHNASHGLIPFRRT